MGWNQNTEEGASFTFVKKEDGADASNMASKFAKGAMRSEISLADGQLAADFESVIKGEAIYLPEFHCGKTDFALLAGLAKDMETHELASEGGGMVNWSKHLKHENPEFSQTFARIVHAMSEYFDVEVYATRLNFYRDGTDWKPFHHDSHAFGGREKREDFTMGASFGGERELTFLHEPSGTQFSFPQRNGDVFAFTTQVNKRFKHGVPKLTRGIGGPRFSIIAWGRRRELNSRNGGAASSGGGGGQELKLPTPKEAGGYSAMTGAGGGGASVVVRVRSRGGGRDGWREAQRARHGQRRVLRADQEVHPRGGWTESSEARRRGRKGRVRKRFWKSFWIDKVRRDPTPARQSAGDAHGDEDEGDAGQRAGGGGASIESRGREVHGVERFRPAVSTGRGGRGRVLRARQVSVRRGRGEGDGARGAPSKRRDTARGVTRGSRCATGDVRVLLGFYQKRL